MGDMADDFRAYREIKRRIKDISPRCGCLGPHHIGVIMIKNDDRGAWECKCCPKTQPITDNDRMEFKKLQQGDES